MKALLLIGLLTLSQTAMSAIVKSYDAKNACSLYKKVDTTGGVAPTLKEGEVIINSKQIYGFNLTNLEVDFDQRVAKAEVTVNIVMGINQTLTKNKIVIDERSPQFTKHINLLNRKVNQLSSLCLDADNKLIYVDYISNDK